MGNETRSGAVASAPIAIHELELALLREQWARDAWNLMSAAEELRLMQKISKKVQWPAQYAGLLGALEAALEESLQTVQSKDTTRIQAAHTRLQRAVYALRDQLYE